MTLISEHLRTLDTDLLSPGAYPDPIQALRDHTRRRRQAVNRADREAWAQVDNRAGWETFSQPRIEALRRSLGQFPQPPENLNTRTTGTLEGDGYRIENLVFESRPGVVVSANLYLPAGPAENTPGILLVHSHHNPKVQGELQDMGMLWARQGCAVLVMDQLGYGDRRDHPPGPRQDYRFRYITGIQLHLIGDSLMGWMVWDIHRGVDLLCARDIIDPNKIILMGSVAGGGDPAAVAAVLDPRIACAVPFNFGGPQPETPYPLPEDTEESFNYLGGAGWESTRNLRLSGRDGFLHWVIVGAIAPRRLIYAHEFSWDQERDPVWKRLQKIYAFYGTPENLDYTLGAGLLRGRPPEATHCNNIGAVHRRRIYAALNRWFRVAPPPEEPRNRLPDDALQSITPGTRSQLNIRPLHRLLEEIGTRRAEAFRAELAPHPPETRRLRLQHAWADLLGNTEPPAEPRILQHHTERVENLTLERTVLEIEPGIPIPLLLLKPAENAPLVVGLSQHGKARFLKEHAAPIAALLSEGLAVCLPDLRGTGETCPDSGRGYSSPATALSAAELLLGETLLGARLRDLRAVLRHSRAQRIALWGDSFTPANPPAFPDSPIDGDPSPAPSEPLGGLLALLGGLYENTVCAILARGTLAGYRFALRDRFCYLPHDIVIPGALTAGDLSDIVAALAPRPLRLENLVDGRNCPVLPDELDLEFEPARKAYGVSPSRLTLAPKAGSGIADWLLEALRPPT